MILNTYVYRLMFSKKFKKKLKNRYKFSISKGKYYKTEL